MLLSVVWVLFWRWAMKMWLHSLFNSPCSCSSSASPEGSGCLYLIPCLPNFRHFQCAYNDVDYTHCLTLDWGGSRNLRRGVLLKECARGARRNFRVTTPTLIKLAFEASRAVLWTDYFTTCTLNWIARRRLYRAKPDWHASAECRTLLGVTKNQ